jgi:hypothetical protein
MTNETWLDSKCVSMTSESGRTSYPAEIDPSQNRTVRSIREHKADAATDPFVSSRDLDDLFWGRPERRA